MADGEDVRDLIPDDSSIRLIHFERPLLIGDKRNEGCRRAQGDVIAVWDDDDHSAPERLTEQVRLMQATGKPVVGMRSMKFTDGSNWWLYRHSGADYAVGTSLMFRRDWWQQNPFPSLPLGEDNAFVFRARRLNAIACVDGGDLMHATIHEGNTSPRTLTGSNWQRIEHGH